MMPIKLEFVKSEATEEVDELPVEDTLTAWPAAARSVQVELAAYMGLPLRAIDSWNFNQKHTWLKGMLTKHLNLQALDQHQLMVLEHGLAAIDSAMLRSPDMTLDRILDVVQMRLDRQTADKLRGELVAWRQAARDAPPLQLLCEPRRGHSPLRALSSSSPSPSSARRRNWRSGGSSSGSGDLLWEHIMRLLMTRDPAVRWLQPQLGHFQFVRSGAAAKSWGQTKNNENMSFEKMSRSIRQYYRQRSGVIQKVSNKARLQYQFNMRHPDVVRFIVQNFPGFLQQQQQQQHTAPCCDGVRKSFA